MGTAGCRRGGGLIATREKRSIVTLELVDKRDLSPAEHLTAAEQDAIRAVAGGVGGEESEALVLEVSKS